jgi:hypothetical protein
VGRRELVKATQEPQAATIFLAVVTVEVAALPVLLVEPQGLEAMEDSRAEVRAVEVEATLELAEHLEWAVVDASGFGDIR